VPAPDRYDGYHLLRGGVDTLELWSWDGASLVHRLLARGDHLVVNVGLDTGRDPLVGHFAPLLAAAETPDPRPGLAPASVWGSWLGLLGGAGLDVEDPRALVIRRTVAGQTYGSSSASLLALAPGAVRYDFTANPGPSADWYEVSTA